MNWIAIIIFAMGCIANIGNMVKSDCVFDRIFYLLLSTGFFLLTIVDVFIELYPYISLT